jgi:hypothetical protein
MNNKLLECRFCGYKRPLYESHIISKFVYKPIKSAQKKILAIGFDQNLKKIGEFQDGPKEYLFCVECEKRRNKFETYFSLLINKNEFYKPYSKYIVNNLDYAKIKLFVMWNIYAFHVSSLKYYKEFDPYLEDLKDMLNKNDPGDISEYGFLIWYLIDEGSNVKNFVFLPNAKPVNNQIVMDFIVCGLIFRCLIPGRRAEDSLRSHFLQKDGSIFIEKIKLRKALKKIGFPV